MTEGYKQGIDNNELDKLEAALAVFVDKNYPRNPGIAQEIDKAEGFVTIAIHQGSDRDCSLVGSAKALLSQIRAGRLNEIRGS